MPELLRAIVPLMIYLSVCVPVTTSVKRTGTTPLTLGSLVTARHTEQGKHTTHLREFGDGAAHGAREVAVVLLQPVHVGNERLEALMAQRVLARQRPRLT